MATTTKKPATKATTTKKPVAKKATTVKKASTAKKAPVTIKEGNDGKKRLTGGVGSKSTLVKTPQSPKTNVKKVKIEGKDVPKVGAKEKNVKKAYKESEIAERAYDYIEKTKWGTEEQKTLAEDDILGLLDHLFAEGGTYANSSSPLTREQMIGELAHYVGSSLPKNSKQAGRIYYKSPEIARRLANNAIGFAESIFGNLDPELQEIFDNDKVKIIYFPGAFRNLAR